MAVHLGPVGRGRASTTFDQMAQSIAGYEASAEVTALHRSSTRCSPARPKALNQFIRNGGLFDGVAGFDVATLDPQIGGMRAEFVPESTTGGPGDKIHPKRVGYLAMGSAIDLNLLAPILVARK